MHRDLENTLMATYTTLYQVLEPRYSGASRFECDDGWYGIIDELSRHLEAEARTSGIRIMGVREKLGGLRIYLRGNVSDRARECVAAAQLRSRSTCERCSQPASLRGNGDGLVRTLCPACAKTAGYVLE